CPPGQTPCGTACCPSGSSCVNGTCTTCASGGCPSISPVCCTATLCCPPTYTCCTGMGGPGGTFAQSCIPPGWVCCEGYGAQPGGSCCTYNPLNICDPAS